MRAVVAGGEAIFGDDGVGRIVAGADFPGKDAGVQEVRRWRVSCGMTEWENCYQAGDMPWEKGRAAPPLLEVLAELPTENWGAGPVLVPGCGLGHDVRALAALEIPVLGVDISPTAVARAEEFPKVGGESYELGDFLDPAWREGLRFSAVWEHT